MRCTTLILVVLLVTIAMCDAEIEAETAPKNCPKCPDVYEPVCGKLEDDSEEQAVSFGSECIMNSHNCDSGKAYELFHKGKCAGPVQLS